jgi:glycolate oxidase FAD binding subunit
MSVLEQGGKVAVSAAGPSDAIRGVQPRIVARPTTTEEVSTVLAAAHAEGLAVVPRGSATTLAWGPPPERADVILDTTAIAGVVDHVAGDLVVVVRGGTRLADLQAGLATADQRLTLDGYEHAPATIGGLVAHGLSGPSRLGYGTLRDQLVGATFVRADGVIAHTGGRVVKNVAGYDLGKLLHGSWGTLGVLTEATFRLHPIPQAQRWITLAGLSPDGVGGRAQRVVRSQLVPAALELERPAGGPATLSVQIDGRRATVAARAEEFADLLHADHDRTTVSEEPPPWFGWRPPARLETRRAQKSVGALLRVTTEVASLAELLSSLDQASEAAGVPVHVRGSAGSGSFLVAVPEGGPEIATLVELVAGLRRAATACGGTAVLLDGPTDLLVRADAWGPIPALDLMRRVKAKFDPDRLLSPGRFVGGI